MNYNKDIIYNSIYDNNNEDVEIFDIIKLNFTKINRTIFVHEFIIKKYFGSYDILKYDFVKKNDYIELLFDESIIDDNYYINFNIFEQIIKYFYGISFKWDEYNLNDLFNIHAFIDKHDIKGEIKNEIDEMIKKKLQMIPIINFNGSLNESLNETKISFILKPDNAKLYETGIDLTSLKINMPIEGMFEKLQLMQVNHTYERIKYNNYIKLKIKKLNTKFNQDLLKNYKEFLLDDNVYNYALEYYLKHIMCYEEYNMANGFYLKNKIHDIKNETFEDYYIENEAINEYDLIKIKDCIVLNNEMKNEIYYTLTFLNKQFMNFTLSNNNKDNWTDIIEKYYMPLSKKAIDEYIKLRD